MQFSVTDHAVERYRQRVGTKMGEIDVRPEIVSRVAHAWQADSVETDPPPGAVAQRGSVYVRDLERRGLLYVCLHDRPRGELLVVTLWEDEDAAEVPRRFTDELKRMERRRGLRAPGRGD